MGLLGSLAVQIGEHPLPWYEPCELHYCEAIDLAHTMRDS